MAHYPVITILIGAIAAYLIATITAGLIAKAGFPLPPERRRIGCIDGLRGYLAISVLIHHFIIWVQVTRLGGDWRAPSIKFFNELGVGAVALFFMITGLVFYPKILNGLRATSWPGIYTTRVFRIMPRIMASVLVITLIIHLRTGRGLDDEYPMAVLKWTTTWFSIGMEPPLLGYPDSGRINAYVLWSLSYEWLFYLMVLPASALVMDLLRNRAASWMLPVLIFVIAIGAQTLRLTYSYPFFFFLPMFAIGMVAYECQRNEFVAKLLRTPVATIVAVISLGLGMTIYSMPYNSALPLFGVFFICVACGNSLGGILLTKGALVLGECSYSIYLLHGIVLSLMFTDAAGFLGTLTTNQLPILIPIAAIVVTIVTPVTYLLIERPAIRAGARLAKLWTGQRTRVGRADVKVAP